MFDGIGIIDTGSNSIQLHDEHGGGRRSQGARLELPGRIRPLERRADLRRHQERHEPVPRLASTTSSATPTGTATAGRTSATATRRRSRRRRTGATRSAVRSGSPAAATSCSSSSARSGGRGRPADRSPASACRPSWNARGTFRSRGTTTAPCSPTSATTRPGCRAARPTPAAASRTAASSAGSRRAGSTGIGLNVLKYWPLPNDSAGYAATGSYNYQSIKPTVESHGRQEAFRGDYQFSPKLRASGKLLTQDNSTEANNANIRFGTGTTSLIPGFNDMTDWVPLMLAVVRDGQLQPERVDVPRSLVRRLLQPDRHDAAQRHQQQGPRRPRRVPDAVPGRRHPRRAVLFLPHPVVARRPRRGAALLRRRPHAHAADLQLGQPRRQRRRRTSPTSAAASRSTASRTSPSA